MGWAARSRPALIGYMATPAMHWFSPGLARRVADAAGFVAIYERWDIHLPEERRWLGGHALRLVRRHTALRRAADVFIEGSCYLFVK